MYFFTSDEHFSHENIIRYSQRPFSSVEEMDRELIRRFNEVVRPGDLTYHLGDFTLIPSEQYARNIIRQLNGQHVFLRGSHDRWMPKQVSWDSGHEIVERTLQLSSGGKEHIVMCHYAMRHWGRSHYGSWQLHGHSHGHLEPIGKQLDVGVDSWNFYPVSLDQVEEYMRARPDNKPNHPRTPEQLARGSIDVDCLEAIYGSPGLERD